MLFAHPGGYHGRGGPLTVSSPAFLTPLGASWAEAGSYFGYDHIDVNGPSQTGKKKGIPCNETISVFIPN